MWSLYQNKKFLEPLEFSNGKSQEDVVKEVLKSIDEGHKIIFIQGVCGTGKSAIALNIARNVGKTSIVVPGKSLQKQYKDDYGENLVSENNKYLLNKNNEKLKINVMTGRNNHQCVFLKNNEIKIPKIKKEINLKLNDIFEFSKKELEEKNKKDFSADNQKIPCKIEIKEKNFRRIKEYLKENKNINLRNIIKINDVKRIPLASICPYWSPVLPDKYELKNIKFLDKKTYEGLEDTKFIIYKRTPGCKFYEQFDSYIDSDVIVFNSLKYKLESALNRKPKTKIEIIDECDEFLDGFSNQRTIYLDRLQNSLIQLTGINEEVNKIVKQMISLITEIKFDNKTNETIKFNKIIPLKENSIYTLFKLFLDSPKFLEEIEEENYLFEIEETVKMFEDFFDETYLTFSNQENNTLVNVTTTNLAKKFKEMIDKNEVIVLMSGTLHSENVLKNVFGINDFIKIDAEIQQQGNIEIKRTGFEVDCRYENFSNGKFTREQYLKALSKSIEISKKPTLIHINAFNDLPTEEEIEKFNIDNLISRGELRELQNNDKSNIIVENFKKGKINVLFTTKCARGIDFPGKECNSIIFTKYPNPNIQDDFWRILKQTKPQYYWDFYKDKAKRELLQKIYRGLRSKEDHIYLLSPDARVLDFFEQ